MNVAGLVVMVTAALVSGLLTRWALWVCEVHFFNNEDEWDY